MAGGWINLGCLCVPWMQHPSHRKMPFFFLIFSTFFAPAGGGME